MGAAGGDEIETLELIDKVTRAVDVLETDTAAGTTGMMGEGGVS
jgi:hypothetical protein